MGETFNKSVYFLLGLLSVILITPIVTNFATSGVTNFEGARGYAFIYTVPIIFFLLLFIWFLLHKLLNNKNKFFQYSIFVFISISFLSIISFIYLNNEDKKERQQKLRNSHFCKKQFNDEFNGIVISTSHNKLRIRKMDSTYKEFNYNFIDRKEDLKKHFFIGQKVKKQPNKEFFTATLKNKETKEFLIPCYNQN